MKKPLSRRAVLRGSLLGLPVSFGLPMLDAMLDGKGEALAATGDPLPVRFGTWFFGGGVGRSSNFFPTTPGPGWQSTPMLQPLANVRDYLTLVRGPGMGRSNPGGHWHHLGHALSSSYVVDPGRESSGYPGIATAPSIDQIVAQAWKGRTRFDSLVLGVSQYGFKCSWTASPYTTLRTETSPKAFFATLFTGGLPDTGPGVNLDAVLAVRRSVLDGAMDSIGKLSSRVGATDKQRLNAHLEAIRSVEKQLSTTGGTVRACSKPAAPTLVTAPKNVPSEANNQALADLLTIALACDLTRVFSFKWTSAQDDTIYAPVGVNEPYHSAGHNQTWYLANAPKIVAFVMKQYAYLLERLKATPEGTGNLLDRTLVFGTSEFQSGFDHSEVDHPFILAGRAGGTVAGGTFIKTTNAGSRLGTAGVPSVGAVQLAALHAVGVPAASVGNQSTNPNLYTTMPLPGILR